MHNIVSHMTISLKNIIILQITITLHGIIPSFIRRTTLHQGSSRAFFDRANSSLNDASCFRAMTSGSIIRVHISSSQGLMNSVELSTDILPHFFTGGTTRCKHLMVSPAVFAFTGKVWKPIPENVLCHQNITMLCS